MTREEGDLQTASSNLLADKVKINFDVLGVGVKNEINRKVSCTKVVTMKDRSRGEEKAELIKK